MLSKCLLDELMTWDGMGKEKGDCSWNFWLEKLSRWQVLLTEPGCSEGTSVSGAGGAERVIAPLYLFDLPLSYLSRISRGG